MRARRHDQTPIMVKQMRAARQTAHTVFESSRAEPVKNVGLLLTAAFLSAFALELSLKLFYMTFFEKGPPATHRLDSLFRDLPRDIQDEIEIAYGQSRRDVSMIAVALRRSPVQPSTPSNASRVDDRTAASLLKAVSKDFVRGRYYFEEINSSDWAVFEFPLDSMDVLIDVVDQVYQARVNRGSALNPNAS